MKSLGSIGSGLLLAATAVATADIAHGTPLERLQLESLQRTQNEEAKELMGVVLDAAPKAERAERELAFDAALSAASFSLDGYRTYTQLYVDPSQGLTDYPRYPDSRLAADPFYAQVLEPAMNNALALGASNAQIDRMLLEYQSIKLDAYRVSYKWYSELKRAEAVKTTLSGQKTKDYEYALSQLEILEVSIPATEEAVAALKAQLKGSDEKVPPTGRNWQAEAETMLDAGYQAGVEPDLLSAHLVDLRTAIQTQITTDGAATPDMAGAMRLLNEQIDCLTTQDARLMAARPAAPAATRESTTAEIGEEIRSGRNTAATVIFERSNASDSCQTEFDEAATHESAFKRPNATPLLTEFDAAYVRGPWASVNHDLSVWAGKNAGLPETRLAVPKLKPVESWMEGAQMSAKLLSQVPEQLLVDQAQLLAAAQPTFTVPGPSNYLLMNTPLAVRYLIEEMQLDPLAKPEDAETLLLAILNRVGTVYPDYDSDYEVTNVVQGNRVTIAGEPICNPDAYSAITNPVVEEVATSMCDSIQVVLDTRWHYCVGDQDPETTEKSTCALQESERRGIQFNINAHEPLLVKGHGETVWGVPSDALEPGTVLWNSPGTEVLPQEQALPEALRLIYTLDEMEQRGLVGLAQRGKDRVKESKEK